MNSLEEQYDSQLDQRLDSKFHELKTRFHKLGVALKPKPDTRSDAQLVQSLSRQMRQPTKAHQRRKKKTK